LTLQQEEVLQIPYPLIIPTTQYQLITPTTQYLMITPPTLCLMITPPTLCLLITPLLLLIKIKQKIAHRTLHPSQRRTSPSTHASDAYILLFFMITEAATGTTPLALTT
jgi:hypothetical protein